MTFRETLWPNPWLYVVAFIEVPLVALLIAPFSWILGTVTAVVVFVVIVVTLIMTSPRIELSATHLSVGRARIERSFLGRAHAFDGPEATQQRGTSLDARAWTRFRAFVSPVVRVDILDAADPTPYWLFSTRRATQLARLINEPAE